MNNPKDLNPSESCGTGESSLESSELLNAGECPKSAVCETSDKSLLGSDSSIEDSNAISVNSSDDKSAKDEEKSEKDEWLDIIGSGDFKKKIITAGDGVDSRPKSGDTVTVNVTYSNSVGELIEKNESLKFVIGDKDVTQGLDLAVHLMEKGEKARVLIPSRLAYGTLGRKPSYPPDCDLDCEVELLDIKESDISELSFSERLRLGNDKRDRGNFYYERGDYLNAVHCYERGIEYLDLASNSSDSTPEGLQNVLDIRIKAYNNLAASHLKLEAYDAALKSVDLVLKIETKNVKAFFRKAKILAAKGLLEEAIDSMKQAAELEPETKSIHRELAGLINRKKKEEISQREMYKRMFGPSGQQSKSESPSSFIRKWCMVAGGFLAVAFGMVAYRQYQA